MGPALRVRDDENTPGRTGTLYGNPENLQTAVSATRHSAHFGPISPELALIVESWDTLPEAAKAAILAIVRENRPESH